MAKSEVRREMTISNDEFLRQAPAALEGMPFTVNERHIVAEHGSKRLDITFSKEGERELGSLDLPVTWIDMKFTGYSDQEIDDFFVQWDQHFQRIGGA